jgi:hypothetical protein
MAKIHRIQKRLAGIEDERNMVEDDDEETAGLQTERS